MSLKMYKSSVIYTKEDSTSAARDFFDRFTMAVL
jgi:hypothetical protein